MQHRHPINEMGNIFTLTEYRQQLLQQLVYIMVIGYSWGIKDVNVGYHCGIVA